jgi:hypothetical protein
MLREAFFCFHLNCLEQHEGAAVTNMKQST